MPAFIVVLHSIRENTFCAVGNFYLLQYVKWFLKSPRCACPIRDPRLKEVPPTGTVITSPSSSASIASMSNYTMLHSLRSN